MMAGLKYERADASSFIHSVQKTSSCAVSVGNSIRITVIQDITAYGVIEEP
jgi:hypothetical protein